MIDDLKARYPWPAEKPDVPLHDLCTTEPENYSLLSDLLTPAMRCVVELGCWTGKTTRWLCDQVPKASVVAIDHWRGTEGEPWTEERAAYLPTLYETFLASCWDYSKQIVPVRENTVDGIRTLGLLDIVPDLIYVDAAHDYASVLMDLVYSLTFFPQAILVGDDWSALDVRRAVRQACAHFERDYDFKRHCWWSTP